MKIMFISGNEARYRGVVVMMLRVVPEGLATASASIEALTARLAAAQGIAELGRSDIGVGESGASYAAGDAAAASSYPGVHG
jgi:hypothetical protein